MSGVELASRVKLVFMICKKVDARSVASSVREPLLCYYTPCLIEMSGEDITHVRIKRGRE